MTNIDEISTPPDAWAAFDTATRDLRKWQEATPEGLDVERISNPFVVAALKVGNAIYDARQFIIDSDEAGAADGDYREALIDMVGNAARLAQLALISADVEAPNGKKSDAASRYIAAMESDAEDVRGELPTSCIAALQTVSEAALKFLGIVERASIPMGGLYGAAGIWDPVKAADRELKLALFRRELLAISSIAVAQIGRLMPMSKLMGSDKPGTIRKKRQRSRQRRKVAHAITTEVFESDLALLTDLGLLSPEQWRDEEAVAHAIENFFHHAALAFPTRRTPFSTKYKAQSGRRDYILRRKV